MQQEKDYLLREIQKLTLLLTTLINKVGDTPLNSEAIDLQKIDQEFQDNFGFSLMELINLPNQEILIKIRNINPIHLEKITELLFETIKKARETEKTFSINIKKISEKTIVLLEYLVYLFIMKSANFMNFATHVLVVNDC